jgi:hypothetical protein
VTTPADRLRRVLAALEAEEPINPEDATWLAQGARAYLRDAPAIRLDAALGLHPERGNVGWWTSEPRSSRDAVLAEMDRQLYAQLDIPKAAQELVALARRRNQREPLPLNEAALLAQLARTGRGLPGRKQIENILRGSRQKSDSTSNFLA